jgi:hypothetical protein
VGGDGGGRAIGRRPGPLPRIEVRGELGGVRVEAEADLAAALFDEPREPIREGL